jgi:hypothetical protein
VESSLSVICACPSRVAIPDHNARPLSAISAGARCGPSKRTTRDAQTGSSGFGAIAASSPRTRMETARLPSGNPRSPQNRLLSGFSEPQLVQCIGLPGKQATHPSYIPFRFSGEHSSRLDPPRNSASGSVRRFSMTALPYLQLRVDRRLRPANPICQL